jgi:hypothetical protein
MRDSKLAIVGVLGVLGILLLGGSAAFLLLRPVSPPPRAESAFYLACRDWGTVVDKSVPGNEVVLGNQAPSSLSESVAGQRLHHISSTSRDVSADKDGIDTFMRALRTDLRELAQQTGAQIDVEGEGEAVEGHLGGFEIEYTAGNAFGKVQVNLDPGKAHPDNVGVKTYILSVQIEEWVP